MCMTYNNSVFFINNILVNNIPLTNSARGWELFLLSSLLSVLSCNMPFESHIYAVLLAEVFDYDRRKVLRFRLYIVCTQKRLVGFQPSAESVPAHARCAGQFGLGVGFHTSLLVIFTTVH